MSEIVVDPEEAVELRLLYGELLKAHQWAAAALRTDSPGLILDGVSLARLLAAEERVAVIVGRIREIQGA